MKFLLMFLLKQLLCSLLLQLYSCKGTEIMGKAVENVEEADATIQHMEQEFS